MEDMVWAKGQRVTFTDKQGTTYNGVVDTQRRGWVMVDLDEPANTTQGWQAHKMMLKSSDLQELTS